MESASATALRSVSEKVCASVLEWLCASVLTSVYWSVPATASVQPRLTVPRSASRSRSVVLPATVQVYLFPQLPLLSVLQPQAHLSCKYCSSTMYDEVVAVAFHAPVPKNNNQRYYQCRKNRSNTDKDSAFFVSLLFLIFIIMF
jgi:hypothetical protein